MVFSASKSLEMMAWNGRTVNVLQLWDMSEHARMPNLLEHHRLPCC
jgi:hypothetical protein